MKFTILFNHDYPSSTPGYNRVRYYVKGLQECGVDTTVLPVSLPQQSLLRNLLNEFLLPFVVLRRHFRKIREADHILVYEFNWWTYFILKLVKRGGTKLHLELNEKPDAVYTSRFFEMPPVKKFNTGMLSLAFHVFDGFFVISEPLDQYIRNRVKKANTVLVPILTDPSIEPGPSEYPLPPHPYIIHSGALSQIKDGMVDTFRAFAAANARVGRRLHFYLTSRTAPREVLDEIDRIVEENNLGDNVHFTGHLKENDLRKLQKHCAFVVINKLDTEQNRYNFPTKLGEYLTLARPVITTSVGDLARYLQNGKNAIVLAPGDVKALEEAMVDLLNDPEKAEALGREGRKVSENALSYQRNATKILDYLKSMDKQ